MTKKTTIYFASSNKDKLKEIKRILYKQNATFVIKKAPCGFKVRENGRTFLQNACKKASTLSKKIKAMSFSDDSGIEVFAIGKKPGVKSSRFFRNGKGMIEIIEKAKKKKNKKCCFTCALVACDKNGKIIFKTVKRWYGIVSDRPRGKNGFGYDPIFIVKGLRKTSAEISPRLKNELSHRAMAVRAFERWLRKVQ